MQWEDIPNYANEAVNRFLKVKHNLPIRFLSANFAASGEMLYYVYFEDTKLTKWYKSVGSNRQGVFRVIVNDGFLNNQTQAIDLAARIPSNMMDEKKVVLRIAYAILGAWERCFFEAYKYLEKDSNKLTYANAKNWYKELN